MTFRVGALAAATLALAPLSAASPNDVWKKLHRPLHLPVVAEGAPCPLSLVKPVDLGTRGGRPSLPGAGPAYPNFGGGGTTLTFTWPPTENQPDFYGTGWSGNKVLWWVLSSYRGPVLIRGRQLDGPELVRFDVGRPEPPSEIRIPALGRNEPKRARDRPSYTRVRAEGCYAYQIDGTTFSRVVVFQARLSD
jgi:hypothetical protein